MPVLRGGPHCVKSSLRYRPLTVNATFLGKKGHPLRKIALRDAVSIQTAVTVSAPPMLVCVETLQVSKTACAGETRLSASREWRKSSGALRHGLQSIGSGRRVGIDLPRNERCRCGNTPARKTAWRTLQ